MLEFLRKLFDTSDYPPRWMCGNWSEQVGWLHILSDLVIAGAYAAIPIAIASYVVRKRDEIVFPKIYWLFALFILSCGTTHLIDATLFWHPWYRLSCLVKLLTAVVSATTAVVLIRALPYALSLPGTQALNKKLVLENAERRRAEDGLRNSEERFRELADAMPQIVWAARPDGTPDYYNRGWFSFIGLAPGKSGETHLDHYVHHDDLAIKNAKWSEAISASRPYSQQFRLRGAGGQFRWFLARALQSMMPKGR